ncbi:MAG: hypothetical protein JOY71_23700 [Acetobacteraceae bacterium]|nr:hypothetical protein [Acetobacteraceae bacterium]
MVSLGSYRLKDIESISSQNTVVVPGSTVVSDQHVAVTMDLPSTISGGQSAHALSWHPTRTLPFIVIGNPT